jgi:hypothetical protein
MDSFRTELNIEEFAGLREVAMGAWQRTIPPKVRDRLILLRLIRERLGRLQVTPEGWLRIGKGP